PFAAVAALGVLAGGALARRMSQQLLQQVFAVFLVVLACYMLVRR
ncbi:MAG: integral membrane family protein, partial [Elusimicrobia bacterium CG11_big_fil_rev_8_21_14_0_20_64_6]